jgi:hypothetical protein
MSTKNRGARKKREKSRSAKNHGARERESANAKARNLRFKKERESASAKSSAKERESASAKHKKKRVPSSERSIIWEKVPTTTTTSCRDRLDCREILYSRYCTPSRSISCNSDMRRNNGSLRLSWMRRGPSWSRSSQTRRSSSYTLGERSPTN